MTTATDLIARSRRIVVKIGSSLLIHPSTGAPRRDWLASLGTDLAALRADGRQLVVVSSGAVALGRPSLGLKRFRSSRSPAGGRRRRPDSADDAGVGRGGGAARHPHRPASAHL